MITPAMPWPCRAVAPARQGQGIAGVIIRALQRSAGPPLYLMCANHLAGFYPRFGFRDLAPDEMPPNLRRLHRAANLLLPVLRPQARLLVMVWESAPAAPSTL